MNHAYTYTHISRVGTGYGATFFTSTKEIWLGMRGSFNAKKSAIVWSAPKKLPPIVSSDGTTLTPAAVGGRQVVTAAGNGTCTVTCSGGVCSGGGCDGDVNRIYTYDISNGHLDALPARSALVS